MVRYKYIMGIFLAGLLFTLFLYPNLPNYLAVHWNQNGEPNEYARKQVVVLFIPCLIVFFHGLLYIISRYVYKLNENDHYIVMRFKENVSLFLLFIHMFILAIGTGIDIPFQTGLIIGISGFLFMVSKGFKKGRKKEEEPIVLQKIRLFSQRIFQYMSLIILICLFLKLQWGFYLLIGVISCGSIAFMCCILYSYILENYET
ncbi:MULTISPECIES: DUF1648 domain-containing protein [Bacillus]|uniref:Uncharacterized protein n=1 Tax=Bacillus pseudomycoides TaxID=64104 RepID=A0A1Y3MEP0_9BACI|nr:MULTISPECIES: DUF1648 domain-containing protein [Bacillus cereus group]EOP56629.1 hypothetical protein IIW_00362 [Bacillus cereus VD136]EOP74612.1 hypothetical protein KOW_02667 [Bacillus cereus VDM006]EOQ13988.1 hypothetical protein KOY_00303 [Bacillus cereus VDM021]OOG93384.1 hypothetical protein BTH41_04225 [Bacillus mycoides]MDF2082201.1 DUF1648 domain-containing protein [Bacillus pseudomycoides]